MAIGALTVNNLRAQVVTYTHPHFIDAISFMAPIPDPATYSLKLFDPFDNYIWTWLVIMLIINWLIQLAITFFTNIGNHFGWSVIAIVLGQPCSRTDILWPLMASWIISSMILGLHYSGSVFTLMTLPQESDVIETLDKLAQVQESGKMQPIMIGGGIYSPDNPVIS